MSHLCVSLVQCSVCAQSVKGKTSSPLYRQEQFCAALQHRESGTTPRCLRLFTVAYASLYLSLSCTQQWSDWFSCGCLSVCRIGLLSQVLYSACLPRALLPNSCSSLRTLDSSQQITGLFSCRSVSVLVLLDVRDTDMLGIYSTLWFFSLLVSPKVNLPLASLSALSFALESEL